jgi:hypothetical protein
MCIQRWVWKIGDDALMARLAEVETETMAAVCSDEARTAGSRVVPPYSSTLKRGWTTNFGYTFHASMFFPPPYNVQMVRGGVPKLGMLLYSHLELIISRSSFQQ